MNLALFDFDGTITVGDTWTPFMRLAVKPARQTVGRLLLVPAYAKYKCGIMPDGDTPDDHPLLALATHKYYRWHRVS